MNKPRETFLFHDYETTGSDPWRDRPTQFAAIRTTLNFEPIGAPMTWYCRPTRDRLPHPEAVLLTGITPQQCEREGLPEHEFFSRILEELAKPGTISLGYNSIRFDDEITRFGLYRNLFDPYGREWQNNCSRWDLIDLARACFALRPEGIEWPRGDENKPMFKLDALARVNALAQTRAHDALSDVQTCIDLARLIRDRQPKLFRYALENRGKQAARDALRLGSGQVLLHVSSRFPAERGCLALILPLAETPGVSNQIIVADLQQDPSLWMDAPIDELQARLFTKREDLPEGVERVALKQVHLNRAPILAPLNTLSQIRAAELGIDVDAAHANAARLRARPDAIERVQRAFARDGNKLVALDIDHALYDGFADQATQRSLPRWRAASALELRELEPRINDTRYRELVFRYRAKRFPDALNEAESKRWRQTRRAFLVDGLDPKLLGFEEFFQTITKLLQQDSIVEQQQSWLRDLERWGKDLQQELAD